jgi:hypothetical protein
MSVLYSKNPGRDGALRDIFTDFVKNLDFPDTDDDAVEKIVDAMEHEVGVLEQLDDLCNIRKESK